MNNAREVTTTWQALKTIHPFFVNAESVPNVGDIDRGFYGPLGAHDRDRLEIDIDLIEKYLTSNNTSLEMINIEDFIDDGTYLLNLDNSLQKLLHEFEDLIESDILQETLPPILEPKSFARFPKLAAIWKIIQMPQESSSYDDTSDISDVSDIDIGTESSWSRKHLLTPLERVDMCIQFPRDLEKIGVLRRTINQFKMSIEGTGLGSVTGTWIAGFQLREWDSDELEEIFNAHEFASACTSLFTQMADDRACGTSHIVKLELSGFKEDQLKMDIRTCKGADWVSAIFTVLLGEPLEEIFSFGHICSPTPTDNAKADALHVAFNLEGMWITNSNTENEQHSLAGGQHSLDYHLTHDTKLTLKQRRLVGVLLAASLFKLSDSPWIQQHLYPDCIFVPSPATKQLRRWFPRIYCTLEPRQDAGLQSDKIAAFGILVLELEVNRRAYWVDDDTKPWNGKRSNRERLSQILYVWKDDVTDDYRRIADACLDFDNLVDDLHSSDIVTERKELAVIYRHILEPLFKCSMSSFGELKPIFEGMLGGSRLLAPPISKSSDMTVLFDDDNDAASVTDNQSATEFMRELQPFLRMIHSVRESVKPCEPIKKEIRIAVLDSGIDDHQPHMRSAIATSRINFRLSKSFVGDPDSWQEDSYGHGTHVTQLLLKTAPAAEIVVIKICTDKIIDAEGMPRIAEAIDWAVDKCDAHIISMSFGFHEEDDLIETALDKALGKGKLIMAAASNNGGLSGRSRPARRDGVLCIHATDGKGNKGNMNPSPLVNKSNFATLGVSIPLRWNGTDVWKSGTSFAVPIAVGIAADILELAQHKCTKLSPHKLRALYQKRGMEEIFRAMATPRDGYDFVFPGSRWAIQTEAVSMIERIMRKI